MNPLWIFAQLVSKQFVSTGKKQMISTGGNSFFSSACFAKSLDNEESVGVLYTNGRPIEPHYLGGDPAAELAHVAVQLVPALDQRGHPAANQG